MFCFFLQLTERVLIAFLIGWLLYNFTCLNCYHFFKRSSLSPKEGASGFHVRIADQNTFWEPYFSLITMEGSHWYWRHSSDHTPLSAVRRKTSTLPFLFHSQLSFQYWKQPGFHPPNNTEITISCIPISSPHLLSSWFTDNFGFPFRSTYQVYTCCPRLWNLEMLGITPNSLLTEGCLIYLTNIQLTS